MTTVKKPTTKPARRRSTIVAFCLAMAVAGIVYQLLSATGILCEVVGSKPSQLPPLQTPSNTSQIVCESVLDAMDARFDLQVKRRRSSTTRPKDFDVLEPEAVCMTEERLGSENRLEALGDGPIFVCGVDHIARQAPDCLIYSIGSANKIEFEQAAKLHLGCEIHTFDPSLNKTFTGDAYSTFHPWGIGIVGKDTTLKEVHAAAPMSIEAVMKELGHTGRKLDILKIDCEGCEYAALPPLFEQIAKGNIQVDQLQVEMHLDLVTKWPYEMLRFMDAMDKADMKVFHKERNGRGCSGYKCMEYAIASRSFLREANADVLCTKEVVKLTAFGGWDQDVTKGLRQNVLTEGIKWYEVSWSDLPIEMQQAAEELSFTKWKWNKERPTTVDWKNLSPDQRHAAAILGFLEQ